jgi:co-chaperonin GroES (HSP10)
MKYILTKKQYHQLNEMIKLDIKVGDTIMGGKFKTRKVIVKDIGKNERGDLTINGKPLLRFRIIKEDNRIETFQKLINNSLLSLREKCDNQEERGADIEEIVNFGACDELESTSEVKVVDYKIDKGIIVLFLNFHVDSIIYQNTDNLIWELQYQVQSLTGRGSIKLVHNDTINERLNESEEPKHETVTKFERMLRPALKMLDKMSENWDITYYNAEEMSASDGKMVFYYRTNLIDDDYSMQKYNHLSISESFIDTIMGFFPLIDEYVIMEWFNKKYDRDASDVDVIYDENN